MGSVSGDDTEVILVRTDSEGEEVDKSEENSGPLEDIEKVHIKVEVPEVHVKYEVEEDDDDEENGPFLFAETVDIRAVKKEDDSEENMMFVPEKNSSFASVFIKEEDGTIEGSDDDDTNTFDDVYEFQDEAMADLTPPEVRSTKASQSTASDEERPYLCPHCPRRFREKKNLITHVEIHSDNKFYTCTYTCTICALTFPDIKKLRMHLIEHKVKKPYSCNLWCNFCSAKFKFKEELKDHMKQHAPNMLSCPHCPAKFNQKCSLETHMKIHDEKPSSSAAAKSTINSSSLVQEMKKNFQSIELKTYSCTQCPATFKDESLLTVHMKQHTPKVDVPPAPSSDVRIYSCNHCEEKFKKHSSLVDHMSLHFDSFLFAHKCKLCASKFLKEADLSKHVISQHHSRKHLKCKLCGETFALISHLKTHLKMCAREKPFSCIRCKATFRRKQDMRAHFKAMHPDTVYTCGHCYSDFHKKRLLREHLKIHPGAYPCVQCSIVFNLESNLKRHLRKHEDETFYVNNDGKQCVLIVEQKRNYLDEKAPMLSCGHCSSRFKEKSDLATHLKMHYLQPKLPEDMVFKSLIAKKTTFSLAQEMKKNFENIKLKFGGKK